MRVVLSMLALLVSAASVSGAQSSEQWCDTGNHSEWLRHRLEQLLDTSDPTHVRMRRDAFLPAVPADSIVPVHDAAICERAARVYYRHRLGPMPPGGVAVARIGNRYAVYGRERMGEWTLLVVYTSDFHPLANFAS